MPLFFAIAMVVYEDSPMITQIPAVHLQPGVEEVRRLMSEQIMENTSKARVLGINCMIVTNKALAQALIEDIAAADWTPTNGAVVDRVCEMYGIERQLADVSPPKAPPKIIMP